MPKPPAIINALITEQAVYLGDHGQDITRAVAVEASETVESLIARTLYSRDWQGELNGIKEDAYLTIRLAAIPAEPTAPTHDDDELGF